MLENATINSTRINDTDSSFVTIHVTGLRDHKNLRRSFCTLKVPRSNMGETMRRVHRMGGKIVNVTVSSKYEEVKTDFVSLDLAIAETQDRVKETLSTPIKTESEEEQKSEVKEHQVSETQSKKLAEKVISSASSQPLTSQSFIKPKPATISKKTHKEKGHKSRKSGWKSKRKSKR